MKIISIGTYFISFACSTILTLRALGEYFMLKSRGVSSVLGGNGSPAEKKTNNINL